MRGNRIAAVIALLAPAASPAVAQDGGAGGNWAQVVACAKEASDARRHACIDAVLDKAGVLAAPADRAAATVAESRQTFGMSPVQREAKRTDAPRPAMPPTSAPLDRISTTVDRAFDPGNRLLVIVTQEGQIWQQSESRDIGLPPRSGTAFTVEKTALGGFTCQIGKTRSFRCRRQG
ncbi:MAG: hypothetical protein RLZZ08_434 [Pseudomonadota bacterium]|jgi:hypothetical protein